jgi:hypothetical protein
MASSNNLKIHVSIPSLKPFACFSNNLTDLHPILLDSSELKPNPEKTGNRQIKSELLQLTVQQYHFLSKQEGFLLSCIRL